MNPKMTGVRRAALYTASGGFLTVAFGLLGNPTEAEAAPAAPPPQGLRAAEVKQELAKQPQGLRAAEVREADRIKKAQPKKPAPVKNVAPQKKKTPAQGLRAAEVRDAEKKKSDAQRNARDNAAAAAQNRADRKAVEDRKAAESRKRSVRDVAAVGAQNRADRKRDESRKQSGRDAAAVAAQNRVDRKADEDRKAAESRKRSARDVAAVGAQNRADRKRDEVRKQSGRDAAAVAAQNRADRKADENRKVVRDVAAVGAQNRADRKRDESRKRIAQDVAAVAAQNRIDRKADEERVRKAADQRHVAGISAKSAQERADRKLKQATDDLARTARARADYAESQRGGAPGAGLRRQADKARGEADRLAAVRDRGATGSVRAWERTRDLAAEAGAKADQLQGRVFSQQFRSQLAEGARQRQASPDVLLGRGLPARPAGAAQRPDPRREAIEAQRELRQAQEQQRRQQEADARRARGEAGRRRIEAIERESRENARQARERREREYQERKAWEQRGAAERARPLESVSLCGNAALGFGGILKGGSCLVFDSQGVGSTTQVAGGGEIGIGASATASLQLSSASIEDLGGASVNAGGSLAVGGGAEATAGVSLDGKNNWSTSAGPTAGARASAGASVQYTQADRAFKWSDIPEFLFGRDE